MGVETIAAVGIPLVASMIAKGMSSSSDFGVSAANANKLKLMGQAQQDLGAYRPALMKGEMGAMNRELGAYNGAKDALATMYGGGATPPMGKLPDPGMLGGGGIGGRSLMGGQPSMGRAGPIPMPSMSSLPNPPQLGNGPAMGSPPAAPRLPDPMQFLRKKPL